MKQLINDKIPEENDDAFSNDESHVQVPWYLLNTEKNICKFWDLLITFLITYELIVVPFVLVFPDVYQSIQKNYDGSYSYGNPDGSNN